MAHLNVVPRLGIVLALLGGGLSLAACGGGAPPAESPAEPPLEGGEGEDTAGGGEGQAEGEGGEAAPASSDKVKAGIDAIQAGDYAKAKAVLSAAAKEAPKDPQAAYYHAVALDGLGEAQPAIDEYRRALALDGKLTEASINLSGLLVDAGDAKGALAAADAGLGASPKNAALLRNRAVALDATGSKEAALAFKKALAAKPDDAEVRFLYAESLARAGDSKGAAAEAKGLLGSSDVAVLASAARLLGKLSAFDDCVTALDKAIGQKDVAELRVQRGLCKHGKKDDKGAAADYEGAIAKDPKFAPAHYYLGQHKLAHKDKAGAKAAFLKAKELDPKGKIGAAAEKALSELK